MYQPVTVPGISLIRRYLPLSTRVEHFQELFFLQPVHCRSELRPAMLWYMPIRPVREPPESLSRSHRRDGYISCCPSETTDETLFLCFPRW